jgi:hypothetical protein
MNIKDWTTLTTDAVSASLRGVIGYLPKVFGALVVILIGVLELGLLKPLSFGY